MRRDGLASTLRGPLRFGTPYKLYARAAAVQDRSLTAFLLVSVPARLARMLPVALAAVLAGRLVRPWIRTRPRLVLAVYALLWTGFYAYYVVRIGF